jgi:hypothetical protein
MKRRVFVGGAFTGVGLTGAYARPPAPKSGDIPTRQFGKTGVKVPIISARAVPAWTCFPMPPRQRRTFAAFTRWA